MSNGSASRRCCPAKSGIPAARETTIAASSKPCCGWPARARPGVTCILSSATGTSTAAAQKGAQAQAIGRSRGGLTTKIAVLVDGLGNLVRFVLLPGQRHDSVAAAPLLDGLEIAALIGDKAFDNDGLRLELDARGTVAVIPPKADRKRAIAYDRVMYGWRHLVENFFCKLKEFRRIATRYDKTAVSFAAMIHLAGTVLALK